MKDRIYTPIEIEDRLAITDLYDRQLIAAEAWDFPLYDTCFTEDAVIDLTDYGEPVRVYPDYRAWLVTLSALIPKAQRITGSLRLDLNGKNATTRVPVIANVFFDFGSGPVLTHTGIFYTDTLKKTHNGWRVTHRKEEKSWAYGPILGS